SRQGAGSIAITNAGTIPDRGLYGVFLPDGTRVGELDEEMVYETRSGEVFVLGASSWRVEDITRDRVVVSPAPGEPGKMPFWHGSKPGRPLELGRALGAFTREIAGSAREEALVRLHERGGLDDLAAENLVTYLEDQRDATGSIPDDRTVVVERFRDELGDWRVCVLSPFGARVHAPWGLAIEARLAERMEPGGQVLWSDDGIVIRLPEAETTLPLEDLIFEPDEIEASVVAALPQTALFASVFREAAARALLLPRRRPGQRTPLWQQRQRSADLLVEASKYPEFPILLETVRECVRDVFDMPALREVMADLRSRRTKLIGVDTQGPSPFAQSLVFNWIASYMYSGDVPLAERRAAALSLDRDLLRELLGNEELRDLLDPTAIDDLELELQRLVADRPARNEDDVHDLLLVLGELTREELRVRTELGASLDTWTERLVASARVVPVRVAGEERLAAVEDAARLRDGLGVALPAGLPAAFTAPSERPLDGLVERFARTHTPFLPRAAAARLGVEEQRVRSALEGLERAGRVVHGEFRPEGSEREWCDVDVLRRLRQRSLAILRKEVEPVDSPVLARFLPRWQGATGSGRHGGSLAEAISSLQGAAVPASVLESDVLPARVTGYRPAELDAMCAAGELVWVGAGAIGSTDGRVILCYRERARLLMAPPSPDRAPADPLHDVLRSHLRLAGASFWPDLLRASGVAEQQPVLQALWDLVWAGEVTNDTLAPLRVFIKGSPRVRPSARARPRPGDLRAGGPPAAAGRWSLVAPSVEPAVSPTEAAHARALQLLERHGVLTREAVLAEGTPGGFAGVYGVLKALEESGSVRRGYFVTGLGAAQFALPGAVERLRASGTDEGSDLVVLAATDPAQPFGAALPWPPTDGRPARVAGAYVVVVDG
ncbi:MAG: ATP-dependent helicase Lhr and Lhr-like helicase, partial [Actinomycetota bacterium]|nr:ATP-dependent helicase Lhr and Lhr-like helicase [Actinomycetota bacterium]